MDKSEAFPNKTQVYELWQYGRMLIEGGLLLAHLHRYLTSTAHHVQAKTRERGDKYYIT